MVGLKVIDQISSLLDKFCIFKEKVLFGFLFAYMTVVTKKVCH